MGSWERSVKGLGRGNEKEPKRVGLIPVPSFPCRLATLQDVFLINGDAYLRSELMLRKRINQQKNLFQKFCACHMACFRFRKLGY